jgi:membrane associated rhomboid family serine protease
MNQILEFLHRLYLEAPWCYIAWPAAAMVLGTIIPLISDRAASRLGVVPRKVSGLVGIVTAPFVHANIAHLAANLPPFIVLGALVLRHDQPHFIEVAATIAVAEGVLLWLFGRNASHVGMSGVIFGFLGYLLAVAWYTRTTPDLLVAGGVMLLYGGMLAGIKPVRDGTSWEGHLFGLLVGLVRAWFDSR